MRNATMAVVQGSTPAVFIPSLYPRPTFRAYSADVAGEVVAAGGAEARLLAESPAFAREPCHTKNTNAPAAARAPMLLNSESMEWCSTYAARNAAAGALVFFVWHGLT